MYVCILSPNLTPKVRCGRFEGLEVEDVFTHSLPIIPHSVFDDMSLLQRTALDTLDKAIVIVFP